MKNKIEFTFDKTKDNKILIRYATKEDEYCDRFSTLKEVYSVLWHYLDKDIFISSEITKPLIN